MACKQRVLGLAGAIAMWSAACAAEPEDSETETGADTQPDTDTDTDTGAPAITCVEAVTEDECSAAVPEDSVTQQCSWFAAYSVAGDGESCSFEPAGGVCGEVGVGGTSCNHEVTSCGMVIGKPDDVGGMILARVSEPASCAFIYGQGFELCYGPQDTETSSTSGMDTNICECACADDWPG
jgi:hypothetical protein